MKNRIVFGLFLFVSSGISAQLVNGGFETYSALPTTSGQWQVVEGWNNAGSALASPDYYHYNTIASADIPETPLAMVEAYEGNAIMGFIACGRKFTNLREYLTAEFSQPMQQDKRYRIRFRLTNGFKTAVSTSGLAVKGLGVYFSTTQPVQDAQLPLLVTPQWTINEVYYSEEWTQFSFSVEADQPYLYMTFGLFGTDDDKEIIAETGIDPLYAYYFIDDVTLTEVPENNVPVVNPVERENEPKPPVDQYRPQPFFVPNSFTPNGDGNNDLFKPEAGTITDWTFSVYNSWGERVFFTEDESQGWNGMHNGKRSDIGSYVWEVMYSVSDGDSGWLHTTEKGVVTLIR